MGRTEQISLSFPTTDAAKEARRPIALPPALVTIADAARALGIGRSKAYELVAAGQLEVVHIGQCARVPVEAIDELVERLRRR